MRRSELTGRRFWRLMVIGSSGSKDGQSFWECLCECGQTTVVCGGKLKSGHTRSCGCLVKDTVAKLGLASRLTHGHSINRQQTLAYRTWHGMIQRCENPNHQAYGYYGGRGIMVCEHWRKSFQAFLADMGMPPEGKSLDRIDNDGNYERENCRWATKDQQLSNRRPYRRREHVAI